MVFRKLGVVAMLTVGLAACGQKVEGDYNLTKGPAKNIVVTFADDTFSLSTGASGNYSVSGENIMMTGRGVTGTLKIDGDTLSNDEFVLVKRAPDDKSPINHGMRGTY